MSQRKLLHDDKHYGENHQTLTDLYRGIRKPYKPIHQTAIHAPAPKPFDVKESMSTGSVSDDAARATIRSDLQSSIFVEASAGTGKTTCIIDRMIALVRTGVVTVSQITAITFTNKAASELARRFRQRLEKDSVDGSRTDIERQYLQKALTESDSMIIDTVHAFCGRLLRERPIESGIDPAVKTLDATAEQVFIGRAWRVFCESVPNDPVLSRARDALEKTGIDLRDLRASFETMSAHGDVKSWPYQPTEPPDIRMLMARIDSEIQERLQGVQVPWHQRGMDGLMNKLEVIQRAYRMRVDDSPSSLFRAAEILCGNCPRITQSLWLPGKRSKEHLQRQRDNKQELENWWDGIVSEVAGSLKQWHAYRYQFIVPLLQAARDCYKQLRADEGVLSFHDLLERTAELLRRRPDIRSVFAKKHPVILVDEFQDTDPLQAEIVLLLTADDPKENNWRSARTIPGSLFVVGDPKQSIYRFRRADIDTFNFVKERMKSSGGKVLQLHSNFRSSPQLVEWINDQFADRFEDHHVGVSEKYGPEFKASQASRNVHISGVLSGMRQLRVRSRNIRAEAEAIATFIRRALDSKLTVSRLSKDEDPACRPSDFMLVAWDTGQLSTYADALHAEGIPCEVTGRKGLDSKNDFLLLQLCLRVGADNDDTIAALAVLRGPLFGFSDPELQAFHRAGGCIDGRLHVPAQLKDEKLTCRFEYASKTFHRWRRLLGALPLVAAIERIISESGLLLVASSASGVAGRRGRAAVGAIATLIERLRAERNTFTTIHDVIDWIDDLVANEFPRRDFDSLSIDGEPGNAVRVMNLHKAKGLESPVVFLCDEGSSHRHRSPSWHISRTENGSKGYLRISEEGLFGREGKTVASPVQWSDIESREQRYLDAESLRLLYVAGTRPGSCVVASIFENKDGEISGGWHELFSGLEDVSDLPNLQARDDTTQSPEKCNSSICARQSTDRFAAILTATFASVTPRDFLTEPAERIRHTGQGLGQEFGTVIHSLLEMELVHVKNPHQKMDLYVAAQNAIQATNLSEKGIDQEELVNRAVDLVQEIQSSTTWKRICQSQNQFVEVPFTIVVTRAEIPDDSFIDSGPQKSQIPTAVPVLIHGQIDAVFKDESVKPPPGMSEWIIVDWKTVSVVDSDREALATHYQPQVQLYAYCWSAGLYGE
ncbi:MAG: UvrD-helicase domain-containing protein [Pirellulales bacterium]